MLLTKKGICTLCALSLRTEPNNRKELCTQALFGELYSIQAYSPDKKWALIRLLADGYEGWIDALQVHEITENFYQLIQNSPKALCADPMAKVYTAQPPPFYISLGSTLPLFELSSHEFLMGEHAPWHYEGKAIFTPLPPSPSQLLSYALQFLNVPYLWGGKTIFGIDCSGFVQQVFQLSGYSLLRDAYQQATQGQEIVHIQEAQTGDLAFFEREGRIVHVGLVVAQAQATAFFPDLSLKPHERFIIHALEKVRIDKLNSKGIFNHQHQFYSHTLAQIRRMD